MSKAIPNAILVLRIFTLGACVASAVFLFLDNITIDGEKSRFSDITTFRYVFSAAAIGAAYNMIQLPFNLYFTFTKKRLIRNKCMPQFDFYADKLVSLILAAGVGAGFGVGYELKSAFQLVLPALALLGGVDDLDVARTNDFFNKAIIASGVLLVGVVSMAVVSILTSITRTSNSGYFR